MPGNEVGERVHNFFDQGNLSQDQHHTQFIATNWPGYNNNIWNANERQISGPVNTGPSNFSPQQSDIERGQGNQFSIGTNGLNSARQNLRPEFVKNSSPMNLNGFMNMSQIGHTRNLDSNFGSSQSPMNFSIFNGQHQINNQPANNNTRFQQQLILKQMELQRQQQLQQFEAIQRSATNQFSPFPNQTIAINGNPFHDTSNRSWPSQNTPSNASWQQCGPSNGFMVSPEMQFTGLIPQQTSQSLYGIPISGSQNSTSFSHSNMDKPGIPQVSTQSSSFPGNQFASFKAGNNTSFGKAPSQQIGNTFNLGGFGNVPISEGGGHGFSELVTEKPFSHGSSQDAIGLDPDEEKFLFGNDDNIWEGFGGAPHTENSDTTDLLNGFSSMQSGTWSALMQSAVAETSSTDGGVHEEWSDLGSQSHGPQSGGQHPYVSNENDVKNNNSNSNIKYINNNSLGQQLFRNPSLHNSVQQSSQLSSSNNQDMRMDTNSNVEMGILNASTKDDAFTPGLSNMKVDLESSQKLSNDHHLDLGKSVNSSEKSGFEGSGREQRDLDNGPSISESSNKKPEIGGVEIDERENSDRRESYSDTHKGIFHPNTSDSYVAKHVLNSQKVSHHFNIGVNPRSLDPLSTNITDMEGRVSNYHGTVNVSRGVPGGTHSDYSPNMSGAFFRSGEISSSNQNLSPSQNMLELLHKVDQSKEQKSASHFTSSGNPNLLDTPVGINGPCQSQSRLTTSHGFNLQLAPPSQVNSPSNHSDTIQRTVGFPNTSHVVSEKDDKHACLSSFPTTNQKNIDTFHLENQNNTPHNTYSMPQMETMKNIGFDPNYRESKRLKGQDGSYDSKQITGHETRDPLMSQTSVTSCNANVFNFSPQSMFSFGHNNPQKVSIPNVTISQQMGPSWFDQYGTLKNGRLLPGHNVSRVPMKNLEQEVVNGNSNYNLVALNSNDNGMSAKKRKTAIFDLIPWNKEIGQCLKRLQNLSSAEVDWAHSSNRLIEKVEDEIDYNEDLLSMSIPRRRLLLTTQLLQQVLKPPSVVILSRDASFDYEVIVYSLARLELGDACSLVCGPETNLPVENVNILSGKVKSSEKIQDEYFLKVVEDLVSRKKELENELLRLDKRASILELRLDCQDLERFSVINRFARFHGRAQFSGPETSSSSDTNPTALKPYPQRYVSAHPMPMNVPERVQCLSL